MMKIVIIGAGLAGSIAAGALSGYNPTVIDAGPKEAGGLSNHHAVMRMRNPDVTKYLGCDSTEVNVDKAIFFNGCLYDKSSIAMNNLYSMKAYGQLGDRSLKLLGTVKRYLFDDLEKIKPANVQYDSLVTMFDPTGQNIEIGGNRWLSYDACISTIPMSATIKLCNLDMPHSVPLPSFRFKPIEVVTSKVNFVSTVHQTIYFPEKKFQIYRATLEGDKFIAESVGGWDNKIIFLDELNEVAGAFGLDLSQFSGFDRSVQRMGKIMSIPDFVRRWIILELTAKFSIYSFGRFALWRSIRADDLVDDIEKIKRFIKIGSWEGLYETKLLNAKKV